VVDFDHGALLVVAGPGSGKTRVLTERVRRLVTKTKGHFRVLALTFTNKAANEMAERLDDLKDLDKRAFIGTVHGFCLAMLTERGQPVGVNSTPQIFELTQDRKQILLEAIMADPELTHLLMQAGDAKDRNRRLEDWLRRIGQIKTHPITIPVIEDEIFERIFEAYNAGLRASGAYDFDDLLLLGYRLLTDFPKIADFYRRLYAYVCIDEAQDLNEAQYAFLQALCGPNYHNVMMVGDPKQSIYGFNTSSPEFMDRFCEDFSAIKVELTENFRSSKIVVEIAKRLDSAYVVEGQLPVQGQATLLIGADEEGEANQIAAHLEMLFSAGHPDVEGKITPARCAILGRTRFTLLAVERELEKREIPFYKRLSSLHENESVLVDEFQLALRVVANPIDRLHLAALAKKWGQSTVNLRNVSTVGDVLRLLKSLSGGQPGHRAVVEAITAVPQAPARPNLMPAIACLRAYADQLPNEQRREIYDDTEVLIGEWDQYLRAGGPPNLAGFLSSLALGTTQLVNTDGVALLTVHSSKGLEFEVVFVVGMAEGVFPDYRAQGKLKATAEERRNAFVAVTRSKRLLYFSYPQTRRMPWGDVWRSNPSSYLQSFSKFLGR
jgi:DNA helicase-2/ATP-dependent DNA helicase PcrA